MKTSEINIIIVDDQPIFVSGVSQLLEKFGVKTIATAFNGQEALSILKKKKPHVLLLDLEMPILNGSKTLDNISKRFPDIKVIIVSAYHEEELIKDCINRGARAFVSKNEDVAILISAINSVYQLGYYRENLTKLFSKPSIKDRHYFKLIFTKREQEIIVLLCDGKCTKHISSELCISDKAVERHLTKIYKKVHLENKYQFLIYAREVGLQYLSKPQTRRNSPIL